MMNNNVALAVDRWRRHLAVMPMRDHQSPYYDPKQDIIKLDYQAMYDDLSLLACEYLKVVEAFERSLEPWNEQGLKAMETGCLSVLGSLSSNPTHA